MKSKQVENGEGGERPEQDGQALFSKNRKMASTLFKCGSSFLMWKIKQGDEWVIQIKK